MDNPAEMPGYFEFAFYKCAVNDHPGRGIGELRTSPSFDGFNHRFEVALHGEPVSVGT
jgi:hypothetical protein